MARFLSLLQVIFGDDSIRKKEKKRERERKDENKRIDINIRFNMEYLNPPKHHRGRPCKNTISTELSLNAGKF